jgi:hypothetical protein
MELAAGIFAVLVIIAFVGLVAMAAVFASWQAHPRRREKKE